MRTKINVNSLLATLSTWYLAGMLNDLYPARYKVFAGGKENQKSFNMGAIKMVIDLLRDPYECPVVLAKHLNKHIKTTMPAIIKVISIIGDQTNTKLIGEKKDNLPFYFTKDKSNPEIFFRNTGQFISFHSLDKDKISSRELPNQRFHTSKGWIEEFVDMVDASGNSAKNIKTFREFQRLENTLFRYTREQEDKGDIQVEVVFTSNAWDPDSFLMEKFLDKYTPFDRKHMEQHGEVGYYNKDWQGVGLMVVRTNYKINGVMSKANRKQWDNIKGKGRSVEALGDTEPLANTTLSNYLHLLVKTDWDITQAFPLTAGIDYALKEDRTTLEVVFCDAKEVGGVLQPNGSTFTITGEYSHSNKGHNRFDKEYRGSLKMAYDIIKKLMELANKNIFIKDGFRVMVDSKNAPFIETLERAQQTILEVEGIDTSYLNFVLATDKHKAIYSDYVIVQLLKMMLVEKMLRIDNCPLLVESLAKTQSHLTQRFIIIDKNDDERHALKYALIPLVKLIIHSIRNKTKKHNKEIEGLFYEVD